MDTDTEEERLNDFQGIDRPTDVYEVTHRSHFEKK